MQETILNLFKNTLCEAGVNVNEIPNTRRYWFVRTDGGNYFDPFLFGGFIGIGWDDVPVVPKESQAEPLIKEIEEKGYKQAKRVLNQVHRFYNEIKQGDVIVIPSESSLNFAFGYVTSDAYTVEVSDDDIENGACAYKRRRDVSWILDIQRNKIDTHLFAFFRNQQALSCVDYCAEFIERALNTIYIKNETAHFTLSIETTNEVRALDIPRLMTGMLDNLDFVKSIVDPDSTCEISEDNLSARINVQCPGIIEFVGPILSVLAVGVVGVALFGGSAKFTHNEKETSGEVSTEGLIEKIIKFMNSREENKRKMLELKSRLNIKDPTDE